VALAKGDEVQGQASIRPLLQTEDEAVRRVGRSRLAERHIEFHAAGQAGSVRRALRSTTPPRQHRAPSIDFAPSTLRLEASWRVRAETLDLFDPLIRPEIDGRRKCCGLAWTHAATIRVSRNRYRKLMGRVSSLRTKPAGWPLSPRRRRECRPRTARSPQPMPVWSLASRQARPSE
jgi:hypothetical protein